MVVGKNGKVIRLLPLSGVEDRSFRSGPVLEWSEVQIVARALGHFAEQRAIDPVDDRAVELARAVKSHRVFLQLGDENILHLQVAARMQQRQRVAKTIERAGAQV